MEYNKLTTQQYIDGYKFCFENAKAHFETSEIIKIKHRGIAVSHMILSLEELAVYMNIKFLVDKTFTRINILLEKSSFDNNFLDLLRKENVIL